MIMEIICTHARLHKVPQAVINNPLAFCNGAVNRVELRAPAAVTICQRRMKIDPPRVTLQSALTRQVEFPATPRLCPSVFSQNRPADFQAEDIRYRGLLINHLQSLLTPISASPWHIPGTPNLSSTQTGHKATYLTNCVPTKTLTCPPKRGAPIDRD
jgi:hypothetical protein